MLDQVTKQIQAYDIPGACDSFLSAPQPDMDIVARAKALQPLIKEYAKQTEDDRRVAEPVVQALQEAGLFHISVPKRLGGSGANFRTFIEAVAEIGRADGGTGWATALLNVCTWFASLMDDRAQQDAFGDVADLPRICGIFTTSLKSEKVSGGYKVTGEWWYASGSLHAQWGTLGITIGETPEGEPITALALIPLSDLTIRDTWHVAGVRGSGSNTLVAENVFVPEHRIINFGEMAQENYLRSASEDNDYASFVPVAEIVLVAVQLGLARAAIDITLDRGANKPVAYTTFKQAKDSPAHQIEFAEAVNAADMAHLLVARACADIDAAAARQEKMDPMIRARVRMDTGQAAKLCREAINRMLSVNGAGSFANANPLQRIWRDSEVASRHAFVLPEVANLVYGRALFGIEELIQPY